MAEVDLHQKIMANLQHLVVEAEARQISKPGGDKITLLSEQPLKSDEEVIFIPQPQLSRPPVLIISPIEGQEEIKPPPITAEQAEKNLLASRAARRSPHWGSALKQMLEPTKPRGKPTTSMKEVENLIPELTAALLTDYIVDHPVSSVGATLPETLSRDQYSTVLQVLQQTLSLAEYHDKAGSDSGRPSESAQLLKEDVFTVIRTLRGLYQDQQMIETQGQDGNKEEKAQKVADFMGRAVIDEKHQTEVEEAISDFLSPEAWAAVLTSELVPQVMYKIIDSKMPEGSTISDTLKTIESYKDEADKDEADMEEAKIKWTNFLQAAQPAVGNRFSLYAALDQEKLDVGLVSLTAGAMAENIKAHLSHILGQSRNGTQEVTAEQISALQKYNKMVTNLMRACRQTLGNPHLRLNTVVLQKLNWEGLSPIKTPEGNYSKPFSTQLWEAAWPSGFEETFQVVGIVEPKMVKVYEAATPAHNTPTHKPNRADWVIRALERFQIQAVRQLSDEMGIPEIKKDDAMRKLCQSLTLEYDSETVADELEAAIARNGSTRDGNIPARAFFEAALNLAQGQGAIERLKGLESPYWAFLVSSFLGPQIRRIQARLPDEREEAFAELVNTMPSSATLADMVAVTKAVGSEYHLPETLPELAADEKTPKTAFEVSKELWDDFTGQEASLLFLTEALEAVREHAEPSCGEPGLEPSSQEMPEETKPNMVVLGKPGTGKTENFRLVAGKLGVKVASTSAAREAKTGIVGEHPDTIMYRAAEDFLKRYGQELEIKSIEEAIRVMEQGCLVVLDEARSLFPAKGEVLRASEAGTAEDFLEEWREYWAPGPQTIELAKYTGLGGQKLTYGPMSVQNVCFAVVTSLSELQRNLEVAFDGKRGQLYGTSEETGIRCYDSEDLTTLGLAGDIVRRFPYVHTYDDMTGGTEGAVGRTWLSKENRRNPRNLFLSRDYPLFLRKTGDYGKATFTEDADQFIIDEASRPENLDLGYTGLSKIKGALPPFLRFLRAAGLPPLNGGTLVINRELVEAALEYKKKKSLPGLLERLHTINPNPTPENYITALSQQFRARRGII